MNENQAGQVCSACNGTVSSCWICGDEHTDERHALLVRNGLAEHRAKLDPPDEEVRGQSDGPTAEEVEVARDPAASAGRTQVPSATEVHITVSGAVDAEAVHRARASRPRSAW